MSELIDTTEMYLRTIFELVEEGVPPLRARIAERLKQSGPTVSQTVARMERDGLVVVENDRHLRLTEVGLSLAARVMRRHRLAERLLVDVIGLEPALVHAEACRWEHVISTEVERRLVTLLSGPVESPYGNPIPALEELGVQAAPEGFLDGVVTLTEALAEGPVEVVVRRISEYLQGDDELLDVLTAIGLRPGARLSATQDGERLRLAAAGQVTVDLDVAEHLFVAIDAHRN